MPHQWKARGHDALEAGPDLLRRHQPDALAHVMRHHAVIAVHGAATAELEREIQVRVVDPALLTQLIDPAHVQVVAGYGDGPQVQVVTCLVNRLQHTRLEIGEHLRPHLFPFANAQGIDVRCDDVGHETGEDTAGHHRNSQRPEAVGQLHGAVRCRCEDRHRDEVWLRVGFDAGNPVIQEADLVFGWGYRCQGSRRQRRGAEIGVGIHIRQLRMALAGSIPAGVDKLNVHPLLPRICLKQPWLRHKKKPHYSRTAHWRPVAR